MILKMNITVAKHEERAERKWDLELEAKLCYYQFRIQSEEWQRGRNGTIRIDSQEDANWNWKGHLVSAPRLGRW